MSEVLRTVRCPPSRPCVRIVAGQFGGRRLVVPQDARVRPTADRVREAWMSILGDALPGARVLDLFAGSGALGLEALSRGAASATFVELEPAVARGAQGRTSKRSGVDGAATGAPGRRAPVRRAARAGAFDLAFADPPYTIETAAAGWSRSSAAPRSPASLRSSTAADRALDGDETRRYGDTAITFCHAP